MYTNRQNTNQQSPVRHSARLKKVSGGKKTNERGYRDRGFKKHRNGTKKPTSTSPSIDRNWQLFSSFILTGSYDVAHESYDDATLKEEEVHSYAQRLEELVACFEQIDYWKLSAKLIRLETASDEERRQYHASSVPTLLQALRLKILPIDDDYDLTARLDVLLEDFCLLSNPIASGQQREKAPPTTEPLI
ncbi:hypothetical protein BDV35DRAFT_399106 [Aspergillus flavus]|uniref:Uncharacterized protein n=1 Tax=Aspergillus flavus TaxID=5059 RepID=A0A5N6GFH3_ASPFL|nr:hypothetical protein BDV35DRAFT_399106 [Aspergillus flavus]